MSLQRLLNIREKNDQLGVEQLIQSSRFSAISSRHENNLAPRAIVAFNLFQTPENISSLMFEKIKENLFQGAEILEPSAGLGNLYKKIFSSAGDSVKYTLVENNLDCMKVLYDMESKAKLIQKDFLDVGIEKKFNVIIMNPPFKMGLDVKHILHAKKMLASGGKLVSLCYNGSKQNKNLKPICDTWEVLPEKSFKESGTGASVALLTINQES